MKKHKPNIIQRPVRIALVIFIIIQAAYILAELATGIILIPGKRGGIMLTGIPTIMIACSSIALCLASIATIVDHYDKRPNEHRYKSFNSYCFKISFFLFVFAPVLQLVSSIFLIFGVHILPEVHGYAEQYTFYKPEFQKYTYYFSPLMDNAKTILWFSIPTCAIGLLMKKYFNSGNERVATFLFSSGGFGICILFVCSVVCNFLSGKVIGYKSVVYYADIEPAKFNAVLLTLFSCSLFLLLGCISGLILAVLNHPNLKKY